MLSCGYFAVGRLTISLTNGLGPFNYYIGKIYPIVFSCVHMGLT